ncbi:hypothetical protein [Peribacillus sp. JNUCC41]|uniref:hypothetical protein n=1 Tax=Peribacillus sp. JNUCC41 TaxID=2778370 RepID=UPI00177C5A5A|nr:hypothetical protein [Brevibacillus sp. JNUCC-41]QOS92054.1 hypothetical protein JNUCC41_10625 [Brevibacillus sp. JNUCC-41]
MVKQVVNLTNKEGLELLKKIKDHSEKKRYPGAVTKTKKIEHDDPTPPFKGKQQKVPEQ